MPVAKLSKEFYEKFGNKLTDELVNCLNSIEGSYREEIRDLFQAHTERFDARLGQLGAQVEGRVAHLQAEMEARFAQVDARFTQLDEKIEQRLALTDEKLERRLAETKEAIVVRTEAIKGDLIRWAFVFWATTALGVIALFFSVRH